MQSDTIPLPPSLPNTAGAAAPLASRWRRLVAGLFDLFIALILAALVVAATSNVVELGTRSAATILVVVGWLTVLASFASPWTLGRIALGLQVSKGPVGRRGTAARGLIRAVLMPVNAILLLAINKDVGDIVTKTRIVRRKPSWPAAAGMTCLVIGGYVAADRLMLRAAKHSDAFESLRSAGSIPELRRFIFGADCAEFYFDHASRSVVRLDDGWFGTRSIEDAEPTSTDTMSFTLGVSFTLDEIEIAGNVVSRVLSFDLENGRDGLIAQVASKVASKGGKLTDVKCGEIHTSTSRCSATISDERGTRPYSLVVRIDGKINVSIEADTTDR